MFPSISGCSIGTTVTTSFTASRNATISVGNDVTLSKNGVIVGHSCAVVSGDVLSASVTSPFTRGIADYVPYYIDGQVSYFAVLARTADDYLNSTYAAKRWANFSPSNKQLLTLSTSNGQIDFDVGYNGDSPLPSEVHVILDPPTQRAAFYDYLGRMISTVKFDSAPTSWTRVKSSSSDYFLMCLADGSIVKLLPSLNLTVNAVDAKNVTVGAETDWLFELPFETDIPMAGSIVNFAAYKMRLADSKLPHVISYANGCIWIGGYKKAWMFDESLTLQKTVAFTSKAVAIQSIGQECILANRFGAVMRLGNTTEVLLTSGWIGNFILLQGTVYFCDAITDRLITYNPVSGALYTKFQFNDQEFPSYVATDGTRLYVAFHDSKKTSSILGTTRTDKNFDSRVTYISATSGSKLYSHYLTDINTLVHTPRLEAVTLPIINGIIGRPCSTAEFKANTFGHQLQFSNSSTSPSDVKMWVNGRIASTVNDGDTISFSIIPAANYASTPVVLGESVIDVFAYSEYSSVNRGLKVSNTVQLVDSTQFAFTSSDENFPLATDHGVLSSPASTSAIMSGECAVLDSNSIISLSSGQSTAYVYSSTSFTELSAQMHPLETKNLQVTLPPGDYVFPFHGDFSVTANSTNPYGPISFTSPAVLSVSYTSNSLFYDVREYVVKGVDNYRFTFTSLKQSHFDAISVSSLASVRTELIMGPYTLSGNTDVQAITDAQNNVTYQEIPQTLVCESGITISLTDPEYIGTSWFETLSGVKNGDQFWIRVESISKSKYSVNQLFTDSSRFPMLVLNLSSIAEDYTEVQHVIDSHFEINSLTSVPAIEKYYQSIGPISKAHQENAYKSTQGLNGAPHQTNSLTGAGLLSQAQQEGSFLTDGLAGANVTAENSYNSSSVIVSSTEESRTRIITDVVTSEWFGENEQSSDVWESSLIHEESKQSEFFKSIIYSDSAIASEKFKSLKDTLQFFVKDAFESIHKPDAEKVSVVFKSEKAIYTPVLWTPSQIQWDVAHQHELYSSKFASWVSSDNFKSSAHFASFVAALVTYGVTKFQTIVSLEHSIAPSHFAYNKLDAHEVNIQHFEYNAPQPGDRLAPKLMVLIDDPHIIKLIAAGLLPDAPKLYSIQGLSAEADNTLLWIAGPDNNYGAFDTSSDAEAAAIRRGIVNHVILQMDDGFWTYRELSDLSASCGLDPRTGTIHAIYGLIKGG